MLYGLKANSMTMATIRLTITYNEYIDLMKLQVRFLSLKNMKYLRKK